MYFGIKYVYGGFFGRNKNIKYEQFVNTTDF